MTINEKKTKTIGVMLLAAAMAVCAASCGGNGDSGSVSDNSSNSNSTASGGIDDINRGYTYEKQGDGVMQFYSSDPTLDAFLNEYMERHLRYTANAIGDLKIGDGNSIWKEWESMAVMFMDTDALSYNPKETIKAWARSIFQDDFGYVWMDNGTDSSSWGQSWEFPNSSMSAGNTGVYNNHTYSFDGSDDGWKIYADNVASGKVENGQISVVGKNMKRVTLETYKLTELMANTYHAPFLELNLAINDENSLVTDQVEDIVVYWQTENDTKYTEEKSVGYNAFATTNYGDNFPSTAKVVFPMYADPDWGTDKKVTQMKIEISFKNGLTGSVGANEVDLSYDGRQINNAGVFIAAVANYYKYTQDDEFLAEVIGKARKAMQFYLTYCYGTEGLVSTKNFVGHDGSTNVDFFTPIDGLIGMQGIGSGIGDGYWDCVSYPCVSSYCNNLFYLGLKDMAYLEKMAAAAGIAGERVSVTNPDAKGVTQYAQTEATLNALAELCRTKYNQTFWNEDTGRYHLGINADGDIVDYGFTLFNEEAVLYGLADEEKAASIMDWINGERRVETDTAKGKNIYYYEFAPRWTTKNNEYQFWWKFNGKSGANYKWGNQVQNGGTAIHMAYYDLGATNAVNGTEQAYKKLKNIQGWYEKIKRDGGQGDNFYEQSYSKKDSPTYKLQGKNGAGAIGLDSEFLEAAIMYTSIPDTFFGLGGDEYKTLNITPNLPEGLTFWKMENCAFSGLVYDVSIGKNFVQINSIRGTVNGERLKVTLKKPGGNFEVRQHNVILTPNVDYVVSGDSIVVTAPMKNGRIQVLEK